MLLTISTVNESVSDFFCLWMLLSMWLLMLYLDTECSVNCLLNSLAKRLVLVVVVPMNVILMCSSWWFYQSVSFGCFETQYGRGPTLERLLYSISSGARFYVARPWALISPIGIPLTSFQQVFYVSGQFTRHQDEGMWTLSRMI